MLLCHGGIIKSQAMDSLEHMSSYWSAAIHDYGDYRTMAYHHHHINCAHFAWCSLSAAIHLFGHSGFVFTAAHRQELLPRCSNSTVLCWPSADVCPVTTEAYLQLLHDLSQVSFALSCTSMSTG